MRRVGSGHANDLADADQDRSLVPTINRTPKKTRYRTHLIRGYMAGTALKTVPW